MTAREAQQVGAVVLDGGVNGEGNVVLEHATPTFEQTPLCVKPAPARG